MAGSLTGAAPLPTGTAMSAESHPGTPDGPGRHRHETMGAAA